MASEILNAPSWCPWEGATVSVEVTATEATERGVVPGTLNWGPLIAPLLALKGVPVECVRIGSVYSRFKDEKDVEVFYFPVCHKCREQARSEKSIYCVLCGKAEVALDRKTDKSNA